MRATIILIVTNLLCAALAIWFYLKYEEARQELDSNFVWAVHNDYRDDFLFEAYASPISESGGVWKTDYFEDDFSAYSDSVIIRKGDPFVGVVSAGYYPIWKDEDYLGSRDPLSPEFHSNGYVTTILGGQAAKVVVPTDTLDMMGKSMREMRVWVEIRTSDPIDQEVPLVVRRELTFYVVD